MHIDWKKALLIIETVEGVFAKTGLDIHGVNGQELQHITETALTTGKTVVEAVKEIKAEVGSHPTPSGAAGTI